MTAGATEHRRIARTMPPKKIWLLSLFNLAVSLLFAWLWGPKDTDFITYSVMADSFRNTGQFLWVDGVPTHHFPPLWPMLLSPFPGLWPKLIVAVIVSWLCLWGIYWATKNLFRKREAEQMAWWLFLLPWFPMIAADGFSETAVAFTYALCIRALLLSENDQDYVITAGFWAGVTYLLKASMGYFFIISAITGLAWRLTHRGKAGITKQYLWGGIAFLGIVLPWTLRNVRDFGWSGWETQPYVSFAIQHAYTSKAYWFGVAEVALVGIGMTILSLAFFYLARRKMGYRMQLILSAESDSLLLIAAVLPIIISCFISAAFDWWEGRPYNDGNFVRYLIPAFIPLMWLLIHASRKGERIL